MSDKPNILFTAPPGTIRDDLWSGPAQRCAAELGYHVRMLPHCPHRNDEARWAEAIHGVDALITTWGAPRLTDAVLASNSTLRIVGHAAGSVAGIVSDALYRREIHIVSSNDEMARSVAEWSLMMTQMAARRILTHAQFGVGNTLKWTTGHTAPRGLHTLTIGIWGLGAVARQLITLLAPFEPHAILVHSDHLDHELARCLGVHKVELDDLFARCDVVHLLEGLTPASCGRITARHLAAMPNGATLINAGRAALVEELALLEELRRQRIAAILDVHYVEPLPLESPFRSLPNVILTPHNAGYGRREFYMPHVLREFDRFFNGRPLQHEVLPAAIAHMTDESLVGP